MMIPSTLRRRCEKWPLAFGALLAVLVLMGSFRIGQTHATWSDFHLFADMSAAAGVWTQDPEVLLPAECDLLDEGEFHWGYNLIVGTEGDDTLTGTNDPDLIFGLGGHDTIQGGNQSDCLVGGEGNDVLGGDRRDENGQDVLLGGPGNDRLDGGNGKDGLYGGGGEDTLDGRNGKDLVYGQGGNDTLFGSNSTDLLDGGSGTDTCTGGRAPDVYKECEDGDLSSLSSPEVAPLEKSASLETTDEDETEGETETKLLAPESDSSTGDPKDDETEPEKPTDEATKTEVSTEKDTTVETEGAQP